MGQSKRKITNWPEYNKALKQRVSITFWVDESVRNGWYNTKQSGVRGRSHRYTDVAIETCLVVKGIFSLSLRATEGFLDSIFEILGVDIKAPDYSSVSKRAQTVEINYRPPSRGSAVHLVIDSTGLKVFGEGEWKTRKHGKEKRREWRKIHLAIDAESHDIVSGDISMDWVHDSKVLPSLLNPLRRKIHQVSADGAYDTRECYEVIAKKNAKPTIPPRSNAAMWEAEHPRNAATTALLNGKLDEWKVENDYHKRSLSETAMYRWKQLMRAKLTFRNYNAQAGEVYAGIKALNKLTGLGMPERESFVG